MSKQLKPSLFRRIWNSLRFSSKRRSATIDVTRDGFTLTAGRAPKETRWDDVTEIDAGVRDFITYDTFYVIVYANGAELTIEEFYDGFRQLEHAMLERWPQIKESWQRLYSLPLHVVEYEVLWRRGDAV